MEEVNSERNVLMRKKIHEILPGLSISREQFHSNSKKIKNIQT
jgi:hypothetical protein